MKKLIFSLLFCLSVVVSFAQSQRLVLVEEFTNASCGPCALSNPAFNTLMANNSTKVVAIRNHTSFPGYDPFYAQNPTQNQARTIYYQVTAVPTARMDGGGVFLGDVTQSAIDAEYAIASPFSLKLSFFISSDNDSIYAKATVKALTAISGTLKAQIAVVEKMVSFTTPPGSNGELNFPLVMKKMLPSETGTSLPSIMYAGDSIVINVGWLLSNVYNINQLAVVGFVQDNTTKNVKQAAYAPTAQTVVPPSPPTITINTITNSLCTNNGAININVSGGTQPYTYHWSNNSTSQDISALSAGNYSVTVSGGTASATANYVVQQLELGQPVITSMSDKTACSIKMNWSSVTGAGYYKVKFKQLDSATWSTPVNVGNTSSYIFNSLVPGSKYNFAIASFCAGGSTVGYVPVIDSTAKCEAITTSTSSINSSTSATINWSSPCFSIGYRIIYRVAGTSTWTSKPSTTTNYTFLNLVPNTTYEYKIRNRCGISPNVALWTTSQYFTTPAQRAESELQITDLTEPLIYPNPNSASFNITGSFNENAKTALIEIYNGMGQLIYSQDFSLDNGTYDLPIYLPSSVIDGLYFVNIFSGNEKQESQLLIQK